MTPALLEAAVEVEVEIAVAVLMASVASITITAAILADGAKRHVFPAAAGLLAGLVISAGDGGRVLAPWVEALPAWIGHTGFTFLFAIGLSAIVNGLLSSSLPVIGGLRARGRRALRASRWGTPEELGERAHIDPGVLRVLGFGVERTPLTTSRLLARLRIAATVVCGSCIGLFVVIREFRSEFWHALTWGHFGINAIAAMLVTFFFGPLHEAVLHMAAAHPTATDAPEPEDHRPLARLIGTFGVVTLLLFAIQALHGAAHEALLTISVYEWIILLEGCALPLIVTTYYFGAALYREELGARRWDRALSASVWFGAIVLLPFAVVLLLADRTVDLRAALLFAISGRQLVFGLLLAYATALIAIVVSVVMSWVSYGIYALALGLAMDGATRANASRRAAASIALTGVVLQALTLAIVGWPKERGDLLPFVPLFLTLGWAGGLLLSRFNREMKKDEPRP